MIADAWEEKKSYQRGHGTCLEISIKGGKNTATNQVKQSLCCVQMAAALTFKGGQKNFAGF